ncbi:hypothetical protein DFH29DRAFT_613235 [Suillus ampliporus]|nr:hypothetical protein DFH29DRAFT_613235 [Suillus ampliporus]
MFADYMHLLMIMFFSNLMFNLGDCDIVTVQITCVREYLLSKLCFQSYLLSTGVPTSDMMHASKRLSKFCALASVIHERLNYDAPKRSSTIRQLSGARTFASFDSSDVTGATYDAFKL